MGILAFGSSDHTEVSQVPEGIWFSVLKKWKDEKKENQLWIILDSTLLPQKLFFFKARINTSHEALEDTGTFFIKHFNVLANTPAIYPSIFHAYYKTKKTISAFKRDMKERNKWTALKKHLRMEIGKAFDK